MLAAGQSGQGVALREIPEPITQRGLECQTMAIINGIRAVGEEKKLASISSDIRGLVTQVRVRIQQAGLRGETGSFDIDTGSTVDTQAHFSMSNVAIELPRLGVPLRRLTTADNPLKLARDLFRPKRFMGISKGNAWHATSIIPLAEASPEQFVVELDSLRGTKRVMSLQEFLQLTVNKDSFRDNFEIYEISE